MQTVTLPVRGYRDVPVPHRFFRQERETRHLGLLLPGLGYSCDMPLLYFSASHLLDLGADVLLVEYAYSRQPEYQALAPDERTRWLLADATAACRAGLAQRDYRQVTLVGKSLGTRAMPHLLATEDGLRQACTVWFTPLLQEAGVREYLLRAPRPALVAIGTVDPHYDPATLAAVRAAIQGEVVVVAEAEHALEVAGDVVRSVGALEQVMRAVQRFVTSECVEPQIREA